MASKELQAYQAYRATVVARGLVGNLNLILAYADQQAGLGVVPETDRQFMAAYPGGGFEQLVRECSQECSDKLGSSAIPHELLRLATLAGA